jgi:HEAT repeat protein
VAALTGPAALAAEPVTLDPVEALRQTLRVPAQTPGEAELRKRTLEQRIKALRTIGDLRRALELSEWREEPMDEIGRAVDVPLHDELNQRFETSLRDALASNDPDRQLAAAILIGEIGPLLRTGTRGPQERPGARKDPIRNLTPDLVKRLSESKEPAVRAAAARALGKIVPPFLPTGEGKASLIVPALRGLLTKGELAERRAAAEAFVDLVRITSQLNKARTAPVAVEVPAGQVVAVARVVVQAVGPGLRDPDPQVRRLAAQALQEAAQALRDRIADPREDFPREPTEEEKKDLERYLKDVADEKEELDPLVLDLKAQTDAVAGLLNDAEIGVCLSSAQALEALASARQRLQHKAASTARLVKKAEPAKRLEDPLGPGLRKAVPALAAKLTDREVRVRLAALYVLETLESEAAPAADALVKALKDDDPFVRWGAVRALGRMAPVAAEKVVPGLAALVSDDNGDVRITTIAALERYGPAAADAVGALGRATEKGDTQTRLAAIRALPAIGKQPEVAVPALVKALAAADADTREAAAQALARFGPVARTAVPALRRALQDPDGRVRRTAGEALLAVTQPAGR